MKNPLKQVRRYRRNTGVVAVEFALVASVGGFMVLLFGALEIARVLYYMNSANEATELGARVAIVCDANSALIKQRMQQIFPALQSQNITIEYLPQNCATTADSARASCTGVKVSIAPGMRINTVIPFVSFGFDMPAFATYKSREAMDSANCT
jgi:Flp pilus assembly protein TadG